ncbi:MAG: tetratricopeptide repeat protein [Deltaproteobacteria bacterium]|nr:tetratricopeptide repeat protein [Deltaproteobacteria bacterium]MBW2074010.1 tetratricopeptide repeat protein [Deltaproteobacteria bacterium]
MRCYRSEVIVCLFLILTTLAVFWQVRNHDFVNYDDNIYVTESRHVRNGLTRQGVIWAFTTTHVGYWIPLTWLSHMLDYQLFGSNPGWHHLTSLIFHIANTLLLFLVLKQMTGALFRSAFVAALFALHPLNIESVAWLFERKGVLSTFFWMLTIGAYVRYAKRPDLHRYLLVLLFFALGLMAKPMLVTLPLVLLLLDYWPLGRFPFERSVGNMNPQICNAMNIGYERSPFIRLVLEKMPFFALAAAWSFATFTAAEHVGALPSLELFPMKVRIANALVSYISYIKKMLWPYHLSVFYPHPGMLPVWHVASAVLLLLFISYIAIRSWQRQPYVAFGWLWYIGTLVPVIGLVQVGAFAMADRYVYIPLIGLFIMVAWGVSDILTRWQYGKIFLAISAGVVLSVLMVCTWIQVGHWRSSTTLFQHAIHVTDNNYLAYNNLGNALARQGKIDEAIAHYIEALQIRPDYEMAHNNLGVALAKKGRLDEAIGHFSMALCIKPDNIQTHNNMGLALSLQGKLDKAVAYFFEALRIKPEYAEAHYNLGNALARQGKIKEAISYYEEALRIKPEYAEAHNNLGVALARQGRNKKAIAHFFEALRIKADYQEAQKNLGLVCRKMGKTARALDRNARR